MPKTAHIGGFIQGLHLQLGKADWQIAQNANTEMW